MYATAFEFWLVKTFLWLCFSFVCLSLIGFPSFVFHHRSYKTVIITLIAMIPVIFVACYFSDATKALLFYGYEDTITTFDRLKTENPEWFRESLIKCGRNSSL